MQASNWMYGECYENIFSELERHPGRFERGKAAQASVVIEDITELSQYAKFARLIEHYTIGFGFNTFQIHSSPEFDLEYACIGGCADGARPITGIIPVSEIEYHVSILILNKICDDFLSKGSAFHTELSDEFSINGELYKPGFQEILPPIFKQVLFQGILEYYFCGQSGKDEKQIVDFLDYIEDIMPGYHADTYFIRSQRFGEERYDFYACYGQTSPWPHFYPHQTTFFIIDRKLKQVHTLVFAQKND